MRACACTARLRHREPQERCLELGDSKELPAARRVDFPGTGPHHPARYAPAPLPEDFVVPLGYEVPDETFHREFMRDTVAGAGRQSCSRARLAAGRAPT